VCTSAQAGVYAGDEDPYVKPRVIADDEDELDDDDDEDADLADPAAPGSAPAH
jgi:ribosome-binding factor A